MKNTRKLGSSGLIGPLSDPDLIVTVGRQLIPKIFGMNGGDDGARTRDLCRDSPTVLRFFNDLQTRGERLRPPKSYKTSLFVDRIVDQVSQPSYASSLVSAE